MGSGRAALPASQILSRISWHSRPGYVSAVDSRIRERKQQYTGVNRNREPKPEPCADSHTTHREVAVSRECLPGLPPYKSASVRRGGPGLISQNGITGRAFFGQASGIPQDGPLPSRAAMRSAFSRNPAVTRGWLGDYCLCGGLEGRLRPTDAASTRLTRSATITLRANTPSAVSWKLWCGSPLR